MGREIERKFLADRFPHSTCSGGIRFKQGYLPTAGNVVVRVRCGGGRGYLTIKGPLEGGGRDEFEYPIPEQDAEEILQRLCTSSIIDKTRYRVTFDEAQWDVDVFHGENEGLVIAEIELQDIHQEFRRPSWVGAEVTDDPRYLNVNLARDPYSTW